MRVLISFKNPKTGAIRKVKLGFSWELFILVPVLGAPLFGRKLYNRAIAMLVLSVLNFLLLTSPFGLFTAAIVWGCSFYYGFKGNELTAKNYLKLGWEWLEPDSEFSRLAKKRWNIGEPVTATPASTAPATMLNVANIERTEADGKIIEKHYIYTDNPNSGMNQFGQLCVYMIMGCIIVLFVLFILPILLQAIFGCTSYFC